MHSYRASCLYVLAAQLAGHSYDQEIAQSRCTCEILLPYSIARSDNRRAVFSLLIISKAGGLVYNREFHAGLTKLSSNDLLVLAGTFHGYGIFQLLAAFTTPMIRR